MKVTFLSGRAGAGKTAYVLDRVAEATENLKRCILIVPEQFTYSAERIITRAVKSGGLLFTQVLSPSRLAYRVLTMVGGMKYKRLDSSGMAMAVKKTLIESQKDLKYFNKSRNIADVTPLMANAIVKLKQSGISPEAFDEMLSNACASSEDKLPESLRNKALDIAKIFREYENSIEEYYADEQRQEQLLIDNLARAEFLHEYDVYVDGFDVIAPLTLKMIATLSTVAKSVTVTFTCAEPNERDAALFQPVRDTMNSLELLIGRDKTEVETKNIDHGEFRSKEIGHLERELFAPNPVPFRAESGKEGGKENAIEIFYAPNIEGEAVAVASSIIRLAREKGLRYSDIAVVAADGGERGEELKRQLDIRGVACRLDRLESAAEHSAVKLLLAALSWTSSRMMDRKAALSVLKSGWIGIDDDASDAFENYIIERNLFASRFERIIDDCEALEATRQALVEPVLRLSKEISLGDSTAQGYAAALHNYCKEVDLLARLEESGEGQLAQIICDVLDQSFALLGEMSLRDFTGTLREGFAACSVGSIPYQSDCVAIGSLVRFKGDQVRALFVMGMNEGVLPSPKAPDSLISDSEARALGDGFLSLGACGERFFGVENLSIYGAFTQAYDYLYLTMSRSAADGSALGPSHVLERIEKIFPDVQPKSQDYFTNCDSLLTDKNSAKKMLGLMLRRSPDPAWRAVKQYFNETEPIYMERLEAAVKAITQLPSVSPAATKDIYFGGQPTPVISVSRLETFANCPYMHFLTYGIRPVLRKEPVLKPVDRGSFYHDFLEEFTREILAEGIDNLNDGKVMRVIDGVSRKMLEEIARTPAAETPEGRASVYIIDKNMRRAAENIAKHIRQSGFRPLSAEIKFGVNERFPAVELLAGDTKLLLGGRIDRLDTAVIGGKRYARVVDYKSGGNKLFLADVADGTNLQLLTYLGAVKKGGYLPAGAFYLHVSGERKTVDSHELGNKEKLKKMLMKGYRLEGIALSDMDVIDVMRGGEDIENMLNVRVKKDGSFYSNSPAFTAPEVDRLIDFVGEKESELASQILSGSIAAHPVESACGYCDHKRACMFDAASGAGYRRCVPSEAKARELIFGGEQDEQ